MELFEFSHMTILVADDHTPTRIGIHHILRKLVKFDGEILEAVDGCEVIELTKKHTIDVYILDHSMPQLNGYEAAKVVLKTNPGSKIIMMSMYDEPELVASYYEAGIQGFLSKSTLVDNIETTFVKVLKGEPVSDYLNQEYNTPLKTPAIHFTKRDKELIKLLAQGFASKDISSSLGLTLRTVETYRSRLLEKVNVKNTSELLLYVHRIGII
ncbi:MAG TPA: response regulator transcription factor [Cyclobacteriaceae bacterium]|nr:response regulator transcription factor [Cyclobacteriaceae bacterium]